MVYLFSYEVVNENRTNAVRISHDVLGISVTAIELKKNETIFKFVFCVNRINNYSSHFS